IDAFKLYMATTTGDLAMGDAGSQYRALDRIAGTDTVVAVHAEDDAINDAAASGSGDYVHADARPPVSEAAAVSAILAIAGETGCPVHIAHVSTGAAVNHIRAARERGVDVTAEVCPHHLLLDRSDPQGAYRKMNPPLRTAAHQSALWEGLNDGTIDMVASDHAPHTTAEKDVAVAAAPAGVPGVQERYPLLIDAARSGRLPLDRAVTACAAAPTDRFSLPDRGQLTPGSRADIAVFAETSWTLDDTAVRSKCGWTPYSGRDLSIRPMHTFVAGSHRELF
ncbi:MAG: dihydroorotase family protein, partial [Candidatus Nanohaloarchaea archaeon]|nr:dihydroorotase family protein [Candidatus Nanohaloarchaea archaeon]